MTSIDKDFYGIVLYENCVMPIDFLYSMPYLTYLIIVIGKFTYFNFVIIIVECSCTSMCGVVCPRRLVLVASFL